MWAQLAGMGMSGIGGVASTIGNARSSNKARKNRIQGLNNAYNEFTLGSRDTQGNQLNFNKDRGWGVDLSNSGKAEVQNANRLAYNANYESSKLPTTYANTQTANDFRAARNQALANQQIASRNALRGAGNVGEVARSFGHAGSDYLRKALIDNYNNGAMLKQNAVNNALSNASGAKSITQSTLANLLNMQNGPAAQQLQLNMARAQAAGIPEINGLQQYGQIMQGLGQGLTNFGNGQQMNEALSQMIAQRQQQLDLARQSMNKYPQYAQFMW